MAVGSHADTCIENLDLEKNNGKILIDEDGHTSDEKIFSGGAITNTKSTVAWASRSGRNAAYSIINFLNTKNI